jgi:putative transposase
MSTKTETELIDSVGGVRSEPGGRALRPADGAPFDVPDAVADRLSDEVIDQLLAGARSGEEIVGPGGLLAQLTRRLVERAVSAELSEHLGYERHQEPPGGVGDTRNGSTGKTLASTGRCGSRRRAIATRRSSRRSSGGVSGASRASTTRSSLSTRAASRPRDIEAHLAEIYGVKVGRDLISRVTDAVIDDVREWQQRPLDDVYPVLFLDGLVLKIREGGMVQRRACYLALGVTLDGEQEVLGMWFQESEGAKFWMQILNELK